MDSMDFLMDFNFPPHAQSKKASNRKKHSFKSKLHKLFYHQSDANVKMSLGNNVLLFYSLNIVMHSVKTVSWIHGRSKVTAPASEQVRQSTSGDKPSLRRSLGLDNFPNILLFRTYMTCTGEARRWRNEPWLLRSFPLTVR